MWSLILISKFIELASCMICAKPHWKEEWMNSKYSTGPPSLEREMPVVHTDFISKPTEQVNK